MSLKLIQSRKRVRKQRNPAAKRNIPRLVVSNDTLAVLTREGKVWRVYYID